MPPTNCMRDKTWEKFRSGEVKEMRHIAARWFTLLLTMFALSFLANTTLAADDDDPPTRAARLSYASGSVSFEPAGTDEWVDAVVNRPMTTGDKLWADQDGRVEVRIDSYALRLGPQTGFSFLNLDDNVVQVRLTEGSLNVRVRRLDENQTLEIDTPNLAFNILRVGSYRIDVNENGDATLVTVREGQGEVTGGGSAYPVHAGDSVNFSGVDQLSADVEGIGDGDDFDQWSNSRDQRWAHSSSARYVSDDAVGYEDLDENGQWDSDPEYGTVWYPRTVAADWAPYRYGHWVWVSPWGWTWVDDASWGFAPFHYGRWVVARGRWCWVPSPPRPAYVTREYVRPVYAPALVAWVGGGAAVGVGVAWFPLGPRDVYAPSYHVSERYVERVNVSNTRIVNRTQITNVYNNVYVNKTTVNVTNITYQNQRANNAVTATSQASFTTAQPVGRNQVRVDARQVAVAPVSPTTAVAPQPRSFAGAAAPAKVRPPATLASRNVVAKTAPPPPPAPVAQQVKAVEANGGRPVAVTQMRANQPEAARENVRVAAPAKTAALPAKGNSVNRPGQPGRPAQNQSNARAAQPNQPNQPANAQPNANRPANVNPNQPNANQPSANRPNSNAANAENANRPPNANPNRPSDANQPNPNQPNANRPNPNAGNPNRPPNANQPNPNQPNANRPNPNAERAENPNRPPNANQPNPDQPNANRPNPNATAENPNRANANRPPNANPNANNPNANRPAENRPATNERPPAARPNAEPPAQQRPQQQEPQNVEQQRAQQQQQQNVEQQRAQQQQQLQQQKAEQQKRQDVQRQQPEKQQQSPQKEVQRPQPKEQPKEQQKPPAKQDNKDNKDNRKDRPPSR